MPYDASDELRDEGPVDITTVYFMSAPVIDSKEGSWLA
jgi:hypothetical protein